MSARRPRNEATSASNAPRSGLSTRPSAPTIVLATRSESPIGARSTKTTPPGNSTVKTCRHLDGEPRLSRSAGSGQSQETHIRLAQQRADLPLLSAPADERRGSRSQPPRRRGVWKRRRDVQLRILIEDRSFEAAQFRPRLDGELLDQSGSRRPIGVQSVRLPARAVEREHELAAQALRQRVLGDETLELADELAVTTEREIRVDAILERGQANLLEPSDLALRPRFVGELDEWRAAPEPECLAQPLGRGRRVCPPRLGHQALEPVQIDAIRLDAELVSAGAGDDHVTAERLAELGDVRLQDLRRGGRRTARPEILDQPVARHGLVRVQQQDCQESAWLRCVERDDPPVGHRFERPEYAEVHGSLYARSTAAPPARPMVVPIDSARGGRRCTRLSS